MSTPAEVFSTNVQLLARMNQDACDGYAAAADLAREVSLSRRLLKWSDERKEFAGVFRREAERIGIDPAVKGTRFAGAHRAWMGLRHFANGSDESLLEECLRGESAAIASYEHVLACADWEGTPALRARVGSQLERIRSHKHDLENELIALIGFNDGEATMRRAKILLETRHTMTIATVGEAGPWASAISYVNDGFTFYFISDPSCRHAVNIRHDARVAGTINDDFSSWIDIRGIQLQGHAAIVEDANIRADAMAKVFGRFPFLHSIEGDPSDVAAESNYALFEIRPSRTWLIDHDRAPHARFELDLSSSRVG
ncbi:MAG: PA2169 family four-helix-bundle protein [Polyangiaceae bacterium]